ncbi:hypothetical protein [Roseomonas chloroacetimidivorans]|uniref:hypothetical protein n=1 Tax=Roseomonas chloroacetimidivorans TaxID=1766656 RepID=UPI003C72FB38
MSGADFGSDGPTIPQRVRRLEEQVKELSESMSRVENKLVHLEAVAGTLAKSGEVEKVAAILEGLDRRLGSLELSMREVQKRSPTMGQAVSLSIGPAILIISFLAALNNLSAGRAFWQFHTPGYSQENGSSGAKAAPPR